MGEHGVQQWETHGVGNPRRVSVAPVKLPPTSPTAEQQQQCCLVARESAVVQRGELLGVRYIYEDTGLLQEKTQNGVFFTGHRSNQGCLHGHVRRYKDSRAADPVWEERY